MAGEERARATVRRERTAMLIFVPESRMKIQGIENDWKERLTTDACNW